MTSEFRLPALGNLPLPWRVLLTTVVLFIAAGYFAALVNVLGQNELVDGKPGLSADDVVLKYSGGFVEVAAGEAPPSIMLEMVQGDMRQYFSDDASYEVVLKWLRAGATRAGFSRGGITPESVLLTDCVRCHSSESGESIGRRAPFGKDVSSVDFDLVSEFTLTADAGQTRVWRAPRNWRELALTTHVHMLSVPVFIIVISVLFVWAGWPASAGWRAVAGAAPLTLFFVDVCCWWLARLPEVGTGFAYAIPVIGGLFGPALLLQIAIVIRGLWTRNER